MRNIDPKLARNAKRRIEWQIDNAREKLELASRLAVRRARDCLRAAEESESHTRAALKHHKTLIDLIAERDAQKGTPEEQS